MRKMVLIALMVLPLFADFFPETTHTYIESVKGDKVTLHTPFANKGMSGMVIHKFGDSLFANLGYLMPTKEKKHFIFSAQTSLEHPTLPTIKTAPSVKDKVIGGYLYHNVLLLAPNTEVYKNLTSRYNKTWINPDLFALFLAKIDEAIPTKENLKTFAKQQQVGLIYIVKKDKAILFDPISGERVATQPLRNTIKEPAQYPFFTYFDFTNESFFGSKKTGNYFQVMEAF